MIVSYSGASTARMSSRSDAHQGLPSALRREDPQLVLLPRAVGRHTKFEFGFAGDELVLADEVLTPDSSRFWPAETYRPGGPQPSYDKQYVRDYLESIRWNKQPPAPALPPEVAERTSKKYKEAYHALTGKVLLAKSARPL